MALHAVKVTIGTAKDGNNQYPADPGFTSDPLTAVSTVKTDTATAKTSATTAKTDTAAALAAAVTGVADNPAVTPVENAVATLEADGATPTQAHVTALRGVWDTLSAAVTTHNGDMNTVHTLAGTADTSAGTAKTDITTADTDAGTAQDGSTDTSGDVTVAFNTTNITSMNQLKSAVAAALRAVDGSGILTR